MSFEVHLYDPIPLATRVDDFPRAIFPNLEQATHGLVSKEKLLGAKAVLDIGCGRGGLGVALSRMGHKGIRVGVEDMAYENMARDAYSEVIPMDIADPATMEALKKYEFDVIIGMEVPEKVLSFVVKNYRKLRLAPGAVICLVTDQIIRQEDYEPFLLLWRPVSTTDDYILIQDFPEELKPNDIERVRQDFLGNLIHRIGGEFGNLRLMQAYRIQTQSLSHSTEWSLQLLEPYRRAIANLNSALAPGAPIISDALIHPSEEGNRAIIDYLVTVRNNFQHSLIYKRQPPLDYDSAVEELLERLKSEGNNPFRLVMTEAIRYTDEMIAEFHNRHKEVLKDLTGKRFTVEPKTEDDFITSAYIEMRRIRKTLMDGADLLYLDEIPVYTAEVQAGNVVKEIIADLRARATGIGHNIDLRVAEGLSTVPCDQRLFSDVVRNLIENALKYSFRDDQPIDVTVSQNEDSYIIAVRDHGIGLSEFDQIRVRKFEPAERTRRARDYTEGTGFGLYLSSKFAAKMGGRIEVKSEGEGKGTEFALVLPKQPKMRERIEGHEN